MPQLLTPEEIQRRLASKTNEKPIKPIPKPGSGLKHTIALAGIQGTPPPADPGETPMMKHAREGISVGTPDPACLRDDECVGNSGDGFAIAEVPDGVSDEEWNAALERLAPVAGQEPAVAEYRRVAWDAIICREDNPRRINRKGKAFEELVASVRAAGIVTPLLGRPSPTEGGCVELLAGHRRYAAGQEAGLTEYPMVIRAMDDRTALEVLVFENLDRENLTPLEEARGVDLLLKSAHEPVEIASRMGKTVQWVARRAQLLQLTAKWKQWAEEWNISAAHLELVARLERSVQEDLFDVLTEDEYQTQECFFEPGSLSKLRARINDELRELKYAPWALENAVLCPKAGACSVCPKRSGCQPDLFSDPEDAGDRCLDPECWKNKMATFKKQREAELRKLHPNLKMIEGKDADWRDRDQLRGKLLNSWDFTECKKGADGAVPALIACGKGEGSLTWVKLKDGRGQGTRETAAKPAKELAAAKQAAASLDPAESAKLLAEKQAAHELRRWAWVADRLQKAIDDSELPAADEFRTAEGLLTLVRVFSTEATDSTMMWVSERERTWNRLNLPYGVETREAVWQMLKPRIRTTLEVYKVADIGPGTHAAIKGVAMLLGMDVDVLKQEADEAIPEPKSWEQLKKLAEAPAPKKEPPAKKKPNITDPPEARTPGDDRRPWSQRGLTDWQNEFSEGLSRAQLIQRVAKELTDAERLEWAEWVNVCGNEDEKAVLKSFYDSGLTNLRRPTVAKKKSAKKKGEAA